VPISVRALRIAPLAASTTSTHHDVLCSQVRGLFSAGSVALRSDSKRGGNYLLRALLDIEDEIRRSAEELDDKLFEEYWGEACPKSKRL